MLDFDQSHIIDDLEKERTAMVRKVNRAIPLLEDALHALRNGSPHVTDEYLERVIADLVSN